MLHKVDNYMRSKGYLQAVMASRGSRALANGARLSDSALPFLSSVDEGLRVTVRLLKERFTAW